MNFSESRSRVVIEELHDDFFEFPLIREIEILNLNSTHIKYISDKIGELKNLKDLFLCHNYLEELPKGILEIDSLEWLVLQANNLSSLQIDISPLQNLDYLHLGGNKFTEVPDCVYNLRNLTSLRLDYNRKISEISPDIERLTKLTNLNITACPIKFLPKEFWALKTFRYLTFAESDISCIPDEIFECEKLAQLDIRDTNISESRKNELIEGLKCKVLV